jgi:hypothetical protein
LDAAENEIARHDASKFLGEGEPALGPKPVTPLHYIAVGRKALRSLLFDNEPMIRAIRGLLACATRVGRSRCDQ